MRYIIHEVYEAILKNKENYQKNEEIYLEEWLIDDLVNKFKKFIENYIPGPEIEIIREFDNNLILHDDY